MLFINNVFRWLYAVKANVQKKAKEAKAAFELTPKVIYSSQTPYVFTVLT